MIVDLLIGFLGSGKTTFILHLMDLLLPREKLAVIVNEFGDIGIDGAVLGQKHTEVVELPSGCICCTLSRDLVGQVEMLAKKYAPQRLIIEPSGVATVKSLLQVLGSLRLEPYVEQVRIITIIDAVNFFNLYKQSRLYVEAQLDAASLIVINKADLEEPEVIADIVSMAAAYNRRARIVTTSFCKVSAEDYYMAEQWAEEAAVAVKREHGQHAPVDDLPSLKDLERISFAADVSYREYDFNIFLQELKNGEFGEVLRAKGIVHLEQRGWVLFNLASGHLTLTPLIKAQPEGKFFVAGHNLKREPILTRLEKCTYRQGE